MECMSPITIKNPNFVPESQQRAHGTFRDYKGNIVVGTSPIGDNYRYIRLPCGHCEACLSRRATDWTNRMLVEDSYSKCSWFITLTYDDTSLPVLTSPQDVVVRGALEGTPVLVKKDFQDFFKRFRTHFPSAKGEKYISYYCCGEYGGKTGRPHYHFILFCKKDYYTFNEISQKVFDSWHYGQYQIAAVSPASMRYVAKYSLKKSLCPDERFPPFSLMSKNISKEYINDYADYHHGNLAHLKFYANGDYTVLPRYLKERLYSEKERAQYAKDMADKYDKDPEKGFDGRAYAESVHYQQYLVQKRLSEKNKL